MIDLLQHLAAWVDHHRVELEAAGLAVAIESGPSDRGKSAVWVDLDSDDRMVRFTLWESGEAALVVADVASGDVLVEEHRTISGAFGVEQSVRDAVDWVRAKG